MLNPFSDPEYRPRANAEIKSVWLLSDLSGPEAEFGANRRIPTGQNAGQGFEAIKRILCNTIADGMILAEPYKRYIDSHVQICNTPLSSPLYNEGVVTGNNDSAPEEHQTSLASGTNVHHTNMYL